MANLSHMYADMPRTPFLSGHGGKGNYAITLDIDEDNLNLNDVWSFLKVPADTIVRNIFLEVDELDDGTDLTLMVRTILEDGTGSTNHLASASTIGQTGGSANATTATPVLPKAKDYFVQVLVAAAADDPLPGKAKLVVEFERTRG